MLVLSRKEQEEIQIGDNITIRVVQTKGNKVRLGITAPSDVPIRRVELEPFDDMPAEPHASHLHPNEIREIKKLRDRVRRIR